MATLKRWNGTEWRPVGEDTYAPLWMPEKPYTAGVVVTNPLNGDQIKRSTSGTSRTTFDVTEQGLWTAAYAAPPRTTGKRPVGQDELMFNPYDYGAVGDGVANDSAAVQAAYNAAKATGGTLILPKGTFYIPAGLTMDTPGVSLRGYGGTLKGGTIRIGTATGQPSGGAWGGTTIEALSYDGNDPFGTSSKAITIKNCRGLRILNSSIKNVGKAISVDTADGAEGFHTVAMLGLFNIFTTGVNYFVYVDTQAAADTWMVASDWIITGCDSNYARIANYWIAGIDGIQYSQNVCFMLNYESTDTATLAVKTHNLYIGMGDQIHIHNSNLFEAGKSAVKLGDLGFIRNFSITGLLIAWPGQIEKGDAIEIWGQTSQPIGIITGCTFDKWTRAAIGIHGTTDPRRIEIGDNAYRFPDLSAGTYTIPSWKGVDTLTPDNTFRIYAAPAVLGKPIRRDWSPGLQVYDSVKGDTFGTAADQKGVFSGISASSRRTTSITAVKDIFNIADFALNTGTFSGLVMVQCRSSATGSAKIASYLLHVIPGAVTVVSAMGATSGAAADDPSFTWSMAGSSLRATPVGSTSGSFWIDAIAVGAAFLA